MFKKGDILKLSKLGLKECFGGPKFRLKFIKDTDGKVFSAKGVLKENMCDDGFLYKFYELADRKIPSTNIELLDCLKQNEEMYYE